jgi:hypothetical protein
MTSVRASSANGSFLLARLAGTQAEMGAQHGRLVAADAARLLAFYRTMPERTLAGDLGAIGKLAVRAITTAWQARLARDRPADFAARTDAFIAEVARATGAPRRGAHLAFATMDTLQNAVAIAARLRQGPFAQVAARGFAAAAPACSTAIAWGAATEDGELRFARNFDFPGVGVWDAAPAFVICAPTGGQRYGFFATRGADTPVVTVVNEAGLVMAPHTRFHQDVTFGGAMIVDLVHAIAARAETIADAVAIARERPASSSWGVAIGSARERTACVLELAGPHVEVVRPRGDTLVCTNRYRTPALQPGEVTASHAWVIQPDRRERRLRALIEARTAPLRSQDLARFLGDRVDPDDPAGRARQLGGVLAQPLNVHCVVVTPALRRAQLGVDRAPCCEGAWAEVAWTWDGPTGGWGADAPAASGFAARALGGFVAPHSDASRHVHAAIRAYEADHDVETARAALERAITAAPDDPSLRLAAAWLAHEAGDRARAVIHVHAGLAHEREPYRRGQLLLWGARAADRTLARRWRDELAALTGDGVAELQAAARRRHRGAPRANLMMVDAY